ncbi:hypothetical protein [Tenacibaculum piscium]|uniref:hypothetical protein n=1 Tax=Tenacibaculum piscium TaxID=1458515 RepID=UPI001F2CAFEC|nr:hypothetical protein [Tenacibaculum piscium]
MHTVFGIVIKRTLKTNDAIMILKLVLELDSIAHHLHFTERMKIHRHINTNSTDVSKLPKRVRLSIKLIEKHQWTGLIGYKIDASRLLYYYDEELEKFQRITKYQHPILTEINTN